MTTHSKSGDKAGGLPKKGKLERVLGSATVGVVGIVPVFGSILAAAFAAAFDSTYSRRRDVWLQQLADRLDAHLDQGLEVNLEALTNDPVFTDAVVLATRIAMATASEEKLSILRNAVINSLGVSVQGADQHLMFLRYIDELQPSHVLLLRLLESPRGFFDAIGRDWPSFFMAGFDSVIGSAFPEWGLDFVRQLSRDLYSRGLTLQESFTGLSVGNSLDSKRTTDIGSQFLALIRDL